MGVFTGADLLEVPEVTLIDRFGRLGYDLYRKARGIHNSPVKSNRIRKSIGKEKTYGKILRAEEDIKKSWLFYQKKSLSIYINKKKLEKLSFWKSATRTFQLLPNEKVLLKKHKMLVR